MLGENVKTWFRAEARRIAPSGLLLRKYLSDIGWQNSVRLGVPVDSQGNPIPWLTYSSIDFLKSRLSQSLDVFEFGAGNSTLWWATRVRMVSSCEHAKQWCEFVRNRAPPNAHITYVPLDEDGEYCRAASRTGRKFNIIVIDGQDRNNCAYHAEQSLTPDGVIIYDNSERLHDRPGVEFLIQDGFRELPFCGLGPVNRYPWQTSILYKTDNCLGI